MEEHLMKQDYAVIGLGRFGGSICKQLSEEGMDVLAIDKSEERVNEYKNIASYAVIADSTDETALKEIGIQNIDHVIIAIGDNIEERVNEYKNIDSYAVIADSTDETALKEIGIQNIDHVIIAIGDNIEASILTTVILTDLVIKKITVKAISDYHEKILNKIGVHQV